MIEKRFNLYNRIVACVSLVVSAVTYLLTIEPSASFWDCGEFIASSYKLEVGHPPGNVTFQLIARFFTLFFDSPAVAVNVCSALCSAFTIFFLYLTIVFLAKRVIEKEENGEYSVPSAIAIFGSGLVGALVYTFSDTFWFSAGEAEVYAMSSLFTAIVFWAMTKWYEQADEAHSNRWIVFISLIMGLSIGVHLLNLLTIPALVFLYFYRKREDGKYTLWEYVKIFILSCVIIGIILWIIIPFMPKLAAYFDLFFVNTLSLPYNSGAIFFMLLVITACFLGLFYTLKKEKVFWNTVLLCLTTIVIGFSVFSIVIIRACAKTPTNEYQPDNPFTLVRYLGREQYGSNPLIYGEYFGAPYDLEETTYWAPVDGKYRKSKGQVKVKYDSAGKMIFPRMWSSDPNHIRFYQAYMPSGGVKIRGAKHPKPTMGDNLSYFFDYQMNWMYWRYFMWNFVGRQNDIHSPSPGDPFAGNWESGIGFIDGIRIPSLDSAPDYLKNNPGRNHYYFLPLLLGLIGLCFQFSRDKRGCWATFLMFFMTGLAIVLYLNQPPYQVRERDYAYAGSFYSFSIWVGLGIIAIYSFVEKWLKSPIAKTAVASAVGVLCLGVPVLMAEENWDDHDRSNRATAVEMAYNYLNSVGPQGILITHGDNDTFPLWYAQEVENIRTDVRICNTSLLGTDWHIDQMKYACNDSKPLNLQVGLKQYLYGTNEYIMIYDKRDTIIPLKQVMEVFRHPQAKVTLQDGSKEDYIMSRKFSIPVNKENVLKAGILPEKFADQIPSEIVLTMSPDKNYLSKPELFMLDLLSGYDWSRPINTLNMGGDLNVGIKEYLMFDGCSYRFVPIKTNTSLSKVGICDVDDLYNKVKNVFKWDALSRKDYYIDYQNFYTFVGVVSQRRLFTQVAEKLTERGDKEKAIEILDLCQKCVPKENFPLDMSYLSLNNERDVMMIIEAYKDAGATDKALALAKEFCESLLVSAKFYSENYYLTDTFLKRVCDLLSYEIGLVDRLGDKQASEEYEEILLGYINDMNE